MDDECFECGGTGIDPVDADEPCFNCDGLGYLVPDEDDDLFEDDREAMTLALSDMDEDDEE